MDKISENLNSFYRQHLCPAKYSCWLCWDKTEMSLECAKVMFCARWYCFDNIDNTVLNSWIKYPPIRLDCLIWLQYIIGCFIFLGISMEQEALVTQLGELLW